MRSFVFRFSHASVFLLVATAKSTYNIGSACLTADATLQAVFCLWHYKDKQAKPSAVFSGINISMQILSAASSTVLVALTRYPAIWKHLSMSGIRTRYHELYAETRVLSRTQQSLFFLYAVLGSMSCGARGLSSYLGTEVILYERFQMKRAWVDVIALVISVTVALSGLCFNLSNMLGNAIAYLKSPSSHLWNNVAGCIKQPSCRVSYRPIVSGIAIFVGAAVTRYFMMEFLKRRNAPMSMQLIGQAGFFIAELVMGAFTMGSCLSENWWPKAKEAMGSSKWFSLYVLSDAFTTWLCYATLTLYSISTAIFVEKSPAATHGDALCPADQNKADFVSRAVFLVLSVGVSIPMVVAYFNYLLHPAKAGYDTYLASLSSCCVRERGLQSRREHNTLLPAIQNGDEESDDASLLLLF